MTGSTMTDAAKTLLLPTLEQEEIPGCNLVWCASFQLAWDRLTDAAGGAVQLRGAITWMLESTGTRRSRRRVLRER
jgi:hypothetical protein